MECLFAEGDYVIWKKDVPEFIKPALQKYGRGPFRIEEVTPTPSVGIFTQGRFLKSACWLVLSKNGCLVSNEDGGPKEFSGYWFKPFLQ